MTKGTTPDPLLRYGFYAFIVTMPLETAVSGSLGTLSQLVGLGFAAIAALQPRTSFDLPPAAFWWLSGYILIYVVLGFTQGDQQSSAMMSRLITLMQMLVLLWIASNLLRDRDICTGGLRALALSTFMVAMLHLSGIGVVEISQGRSSMFGDNPNTLGAKLSLGLLALVGLAYGRGGLGTESRMIAAGGLGVIAIAIVMTGSRGALLALLVGLVCLLFQPGARVSRAKVALVAIAAIVFVVWSAYTNEAMRVRWERTFMHGSLAAREEIIPAAWEMFLERPVLGWGPVLHSTELGARFGQEFKDEHNLYLWILNETGVVGAFPFFVGLGACCISAWRARQGREGALPLAMLACLLIVNMSGSWSNRKLFWFVLAYVLASGPRRLVDQRGKQSEVGRYLYNTKYRWA